MGTSRKPDQMTMAQVRFLADYVDDVCHGENEWLRGAERDKFVAKVTGMDFDGQADQAEIRVARNLNAKGMFSSFDEHGVATGARGLCVVFSAEGAGALYDAMLGTARGAKVRSKADQRR